MHASPSFENQPNTNEVTVGELSLFELLNLEPGPPSIISSMLSSSQNTYLSCNEVWDSTTGIDTIRISSRKRIRKEIGRFGRNIKQKLCCATFEEDFLQVQTLINPEISIENCTPIFHAESVSRLREAGLQQLPNQP